MVIRFLFICVFLTSFSVSASPDIEHWKTDNGGRVYFVAAPELPMLDVQVVFDAGSAQDKDLPGIALLTNAMLSEGADNLTADEVAAAFDDVGAKFSNSSQRDMAVLGLRSLTAEPALTKALDMFRKVLTKADFPQSAFDRIQKQMMIGLQAEKQSPRAITSRAFYQHLYGEHPYATMPAGDEDVVPHLTVKAVKKFYQRYYVARNATIVLVGDIDRGQAEKIAEQMLSDLPEGEMADPKPSVAQLAEAKKVMIDHPSSQTHIKMGQPGISRDDPDYFPLYVGNHILGGSGLVSQLSNEIREKRGLAYSVYSYFIPMHEKGPYQLGLQTRNDQAEQALNVVRETLEKFIQQGPTEQELTAAKQNITGGFALRLDSNSKIADYLTVIGFYGLPLDYLKSYKDKVNAVTIEQITDAFMRRVHPDKMVTVMVGGTAK